MKKVITLSLTILLVFSFVFGTAATVSAKKHTIRGPWIGVYAQSIDEDIKEAFDLARSEGIVIVEVMDDSPADEAGLRKKDIIIKFDGEDVDGSKQLKEYVLDKEVGDETEVIVIRNGQTKPVRIKIGNRPKGSTNEKTILKYYCVPDANKNMHFSGTSGYIGVGIQDLSDQLGEYFGVDDGRGVLVAEVMEDSPAEQAGLKAGDVIIAVNNEAVAESGELSGIISQMEEGEEAEIKYLRDKAEKSVTVEVSEDAVGMSAFMAPGMNCLPSIGKGKNVEMRWFGTHDDDTYDIIVDDNDDTYDIIVDDNDDEKLMELKKEVQELREAIKELEKKLE